jgi:mono/diheme cytochrome c family protein
MKTVGRTVPVSHHFLRLGGDASPYLKLFFAAGTFALLAACSKQAPPPAVAAVPAKPAAPHAAPPAPPPPGPVAAPPVPESRPSDSPAKASATAEGLAKEGAVLFENNCATCHMADGSGVPFLQPAIKGSALLSNADPQYLLTLILRGSPSLGEGAKAFENDMPPLDQLTDAEISALATYVRQRFAAVPVTKSVTPAEVAVARARPGMPQ